MANIDIKYIGLTGQRYNLTIDNGQTVTQLRAAIASAEGLTLTYYGNISLESNITRNFINNPLDSLATIGATSGSVFICKPFSAATRESRQLQKLEIAQEKRQADGNTSAIFYRENNTYDVSLLPTSYSGNTLVDNPNLSGLLEGRPWLNVAGITFADNIWRTDYEGYHNEDPSFFNTALLKASPNNYNGADTTINEPGLVNNTSIEYKGYFLASYTGTHTFYLNSDDGSYLWVGLTALSGYTTANALINNGGLHGMNEVSATTDLVAGTYYPFRIQFGNGPAGPGQLIASYAWPGQAKSNVWTGKIFYNSATNGF